tara:strand:- start:1164 stop:1538 length:375 start_codon:yes stop_codon:yes gene_type:complete
MYTIGNFSTISQIKRLNESSGRHWFSPSSMRCFNSRVHDNVYGGCVFVTSEKNDMPYCAPQPRVYTVRVAMDDGSIQTYGSMGDYATRADAHADARWLATRLKNGTMEYDTSEYKFVEVTILKD